MARGTFANIRLVNKFIGKAAPKTIHIPSGEQVRKLKITTPPNKSYSFIKKFFNSTRIYDKFVLLLTY